MLNAIKIGNFKAFGETQRIPLKPITLLYGPNSAGKSSIIHSLVLADEVCNTSNLDVQRTVLGEEAIDLGGFRQFVYRRELSRLVNWGMECKWIEDSEPVHDDHKNEKNVAVEIEFGFDDLLPMSDSQLNIQSYKIDIEGEKLIDLSWHNNNFSFNTYNVDHPYFLADFDLLYNRMNLPVDKDTLKTTIKSYISDYLSKVVVYNNYFLPFRSNIDLKKHMNTISETYINQKFEKTIVAEYFLDLFLTKVLTDMSDIANNIFNRLTYLSPLRSLPPRHLALLDYHDPVWTKGQGRAWLRLLEDSMVRSNVNKWLGSEKLQTKYELGTKMLVDQAREKQQESIAEFKDYLTNADLTRNGDAVKKLDELSSKILDADEFSSDKEIFPDMFLRDMSNNTIVSHRDVGIGISQVLPVLVSAFGNQNRIVCIEQPEIHLHPALQSELGDLFLQSAIGDSKNTFIIETHSEHLLLRILRRIRETTDGKQTDDALQVTPNDVSVLFCKPNEEGTEIVELPITERGDFSKPWPNGFFEERIPEIFSL